MLRVWRLCRRRYAGRAFDGEGARLHGARWNPPGVAVVYTSATISLAALEALVHFDAEDAPDDLIIIPADVPATVKVREVAIEDLPRNWRSTPAPRALQELGAAWARSLDTLVMSVPSAVVPHERNYLINPAHPSVSALRVGDPERFSFDARLWK